MLLRLPHKLVQDDVYETFFIPSGSLVHPNIWVVVFFHTYVLGLTRVRGVMHDPDVYDSPHKFMLERYLLSAKSDAVLPDPRSFSFGYGRR